MNKHHRCHRAAYEDRGKNAYEQDFPCQFQWRSNRAEAERRCRRTEDPVGRHWRYHIDQPVVLALHGLNRNNGCIGERYLMLHATL